MKIPVFLKIYGSSPNPVVCVAELDTTTCFVETKSATNTRYSSPQLFADISPIDAPELNYCVVYNAAYGQFVLHRKSDSELIQKFIDDALTDGFTDEGDVFFSPIVYSEVSIIICEFGGEWSVVEVNIETDKDITKDNFTEFPEVQQALARSTIVHSFLLSWRQYEV